MSGPLDQGSALGGGGNSVELVFLIVAFIIYFTEHKKRRHRY